MLNNMYEAFFYEWNWMKVELQFSRTIFGRVYEGITSCCDFVIGLKVDLIDELVLLRIYFHSHSKVT